MNNNRRSWYYAWIWNLYVSIHDFNNDTNDLKEIPQIFISFLRSNDVYFHDTHFFDHKTCLENYFIPVVEYNWIDQFKASTNTSNKLDGGFSLPNRYPHTPWTKGFFFLFFSLPVGRHCPFQDLLVVSTSTPLHTLQIKGWIIREKRIQCVPLPLLYY